MAAFRAIIAMERPEMLRAMERKVTKETTTTSICKGCKNALGDCYPCNNQCEFRVDMEESNGMSKE